MSAIEIAEGALLADIAVLFQLAVIYLPVIDLLTRFEIPIVLAVLVLRRGLGDHPGHPSAGGSGARSGWWCW